MSGAPSLNLHVIVKPPPRRVYLELLSVLLVNVSTLWGGLACL